MEDIVLKEESYKIIGACMEVHNYLGDGFSEKVYQDALEIEFQKHAIPYEREKELQVEYKGTTLGHTFQPDFICYGKIILELKAVTELDDGNRQQTMNYMTIADMPLSLLVNFRGFRIQHERFVNKNI